MTKSKLTLTIWRLSLAGLLVGATAGRATTDYGPAVDRMLTCPKYYTTGYGKKFVAIHDMEGYYLTGISYLQRCDLNANGDYTVSVSCHYVVNGLKDYASDAERGEISQLVRDANYSWHAGCWNRYSVSTEHEGFVSNPAWYTEEMYQASALLHRHLCDKYGIPKDRNHVVGHYQWQDSAWVNYCIANFGFDPRCNSHTDPGPYWDWTHFMALLNDDSPPEPTTYTQALTNIFSGGTNLVDKSATTTPNDGVTFSNAVKAAFAAGRGGVFDFPTTIANGTTLYRGTYAGATRCLHLTSSEPMQNATPGGGTYYPISNPNITTTQPASADYTLTVGPVYDEVSNLVLPGVAVTSIGFVVLSRTDAAYPQDVRATATFNDDTTQVATSTIGNPRGTDDTFFGFTAPTGRAITRLRLQSFVSGTTTPVTNKMAFDDFGFTTTDEAWLTDPAAGWAGAWQWTSGQPELRAQVPVDGTGSYLRLDSTNGGVRNLMREYESGPVDITKPHYIRWRFRLAEAAFNSNFTVFNDRVHFFAHPVSRLTASTTAGNSWAIMAAGDASAGAVGGKTFWIFDNVEGNGTFNPANLLDSHVLLVPYHIYTFEVLVLPETKSYRVTIVDQSTGASFISSAPHKFRDLSDTSHSFLHFGTQASAGSLSRPFDLDSVTISPVPLPVMLLNPIRSGSTFSFSFLSQAGINHTAQYLGDLGADTWSNLVTVPGNGTLKTIAHTNPPAESLLYRVNSATP